MSATSDLVWERRPGRMAFEVIHDYVRNFVTKEQPRDER